MKFCRVLTPRSSARLRFVPARVSEELWTVPLSVGAHPRTSSSTQAFSPLGASSPLLFAQAEELGNCAMSTPVRMQMPSHPMRLAMRRCIGPPCLSRNTEMKVTVDPKAVKQTCGFLQADG